MSDAPKFTRRAALGGFAAAGAGALIGPAAARAAGVGPFSGAEGAGARVFTEWVGHLAGTSAVLAPGRAFSLAGLQWSAPAAARIQMRTRSAAGVWGPWVLASVQGHDGDGAPAGRGQRFGEPLWWGRAEQVQLRSPEPVTGVRVHFIAADSLLGDSLAGALPLAGSAALPLATPNLPAGLEGQPPIIARSAWAHGRRAAHGPYYGTVRLAFVHHTDNPNGYSAGEVPALLLAIYDYHRYVRGYFDIAYNFIIDAFGRIWEAREGGIDEPVIGAHAGGYNSVSTGIAVLGTFMSSVPPPPAISALERLLSWKLSLHGLPSVGKVTVEVDPADAFYTPFRPGQHVSLPRIAGHRQGDLTDCPGDAFFHRLPAIRRRVAAISGSPLRLTLGSETPTVSWGAAVALSGRAASIDGRAGFPGLAIDIQTVGARGATRTVQTVITGADGAFSAVLALRRDSLIRAVHTTATAAVSDVVQVGVRPVITLSSPARLRVTGTVLPGKDRVILDVYRVTLGPRHLVRRRRVRARSGSFAATLSLGPGRYVVIARTAAGGGTLAGASAPLSLLV